MVAVPGTNPTADDLTEHLSALLAPFKRPRRYQVLPILPRTELGRLDRDLVRHEWAHLLGLPLVSPAARLAAVPDTPPADPPPVPAADVPAAEPEPPTTPPEVIGVDQLDRLGTRLPGVGSRAQRSAQDSDSDLFDDDLVGVPAEPAEPDPEPAGDR